jgi:hypothetical protein
LSEKSFVVVGVGELETGDELASLVLPHRAVFLLVLLGWFFGDGALFEHFLHDGLLLPFFEFQLLLVVLLDLDDLDLQFLLRLLQVDDRCLLLQVDVLDLLLVVRALLLVGVLDPLQLPQKFLDLRVLVPHEFCELGVGGPVVLAVGLEGLEA